MGSSLRLMSVFIRKDLHRDGIQHPVLVQWAHKRNGHGGKDKDDAWALYSFLNT